MTRYGVDDRTRTLAAAAVFLGEVRRDVERAAREGVDLPPRLRSVHEKPGHTTPEYRTVAIPVPAMLGGASPEVLSSTIAHFAQEKLPVCLVLALDVVSDDGHGPRPVLIAEARDHAGTRLFWMQGYRLEHDRVEWEEPSRGGWVDPGEEELILDAAFDHPPPGEG